MWLDCITANADLIRRAGSTPPYDHHVLSKQTRMTQAVVDQNFGFVQQPR